MTAFPDIPLDVRTEILLSTGWTDVTPYMDHGPVSIGRGHPDESAMVAPGTVAFTLTNSDARFSPDNVTSPYWPDLVQNTPIRNSIPAQRNYLRLEADNADRAYVNDNASIDITGSIEMRIALRLSDRQGCVLACKWDGGGCWEWMLGPDGTMVFAWYDASVTYHQVVSSAPLPFTSGDLALRVTMDATTGTVTFYSAAGVSVDPTAWTQLGAAQSGTGGAATSVQVQHNSALTVGYSFNGGVNGGQAQIFGRVYEYRLYNGIGGTVAADGVFTGLTAGTVSWTDSAGNVWQLAGGAEVSDRDYRAHVEGSEWPQDEPPYNPDDPDAKTDALVQVAGGGLLRRYSQRSNPSRSAMYRAVTRQAGTLAPVVYWPGEESAGATQLGSAAGGLPMMISGSPSLAADSSFLASDPLMTLGGAVLTGIVPAYTSNGSIVGRFLGKLGTLPGSSYATLLRLSTTGTVRALYLIAWHDGGLGLIGYDAGGNTVVSTGDVGWGAGGQAYWYSVEVQPVSGGVQYSVVTLAPGAATGTAYNVTLAGATVGNCTEVTVNPNGFFTDTVAGHFSVQSAWSSLFDLAQPLNAWQAEPAGKRFARLCTEEGIPCRTRGNLADTTLMGPQTGQTLTALLQQCADADQGVWYEPRQVLGWGYVTRKALYNQPAGPQLSYNSDHLSPWISPPMRDDQFIVNDVTMTSSGGGSARVFAAPGQPVDGGRMSTLPPGSGGVGTYDQQYQVAVQDDGDLRNLAGWRLHRGTVDEARLPGILIDLAGRDLASQFWAVLDMDLGDRLTVSDPPARLGPDMVSQLAQQLNETLWHRTLEVGVTGVPESPYQVAQAGTAHAQTDGSVLAGTLAASVIAAIPDAKASGWTAYGGTVAPVPAPAPSSVPDWVLWTSNGTAFGNAQPPAVPVTAGQKYVVSGLLYSATAKSLNPGFGWFAGATHLSDSSSAVTVAAGVVTPFCVGPFTAPAGVTLTRAQVQDFAPASGDQFYVTALTAWPATSSSVPVSGSPWTQNASDFPFDVKIGGERMTVTGIGAGTSKTGAYLSTANYGTADFTGRASLWNTWSGKPVTVTRAYLGSYGQVTTDYSYSSDLQEMVAAGVRICLSVQPNYNPVSAADLASIKTLLGTLKTAGADVQVTLWHEPQDQGLTAAQYQAVVAYYGPAVRQFFPLWTVLAFDDAHPANGYYPAASQIDGIACDQYFSAGITTYPNSQLNNTAAYADANGLPLGIWECNISPGPNYFTGDNYNFAATKGNWGGAVNTGSTFWSSITQPFGGGTGAMKFSAAAAGDMTVQSAAAANYATQMQACAPGDEINLGAWLQAVATARTCVVGASFYTSAGVFISTVYSSDPSATFTDPVGGWASGSGKVTAPATAAYWAANVKVQGAAAGETHAVTFTYGADSTSTGFTQADGASFFAWIQSVMTVRTQSRRPNGDVILFSGGVPGNTSATAILHSSDYRIGLWNTLRSAFDNTSGPQPFTLARGINGVAKAQTIGAQVKVYPPPVAAL